MSKIFITEAEDFEDAIADLVVEFKARGKRVIDPYDVKEFAKMLADAVPESNGLVNDNTGALMTPESIRRTARHILKLDGTAA